MIFEFDLLVSGLLCAVSAKTTTLFTIKIQQSLFENTAL